MDTKVDNVGLKMDTAGRKNGYKMSKYEYTGPKMNKICPKIDMYYIQSVLKGIQFVKKWIKLF